jgi:hypothetical protein
VPLEGHWARQNSPFMPTSRREARALLVAGVLAVLVTVTVCWAIVAGGHPKASPGCRRIIVATSTGGASLERCPRAVNPKR